MGWGSNLKDHRGGGGMDIFWNYTILDTIFVAPFQNTRADVFICTSVFLSFKRNPNVLYPQTFRTQTIRTQS